MGGPGYDAANALAVDAAGNAFVAGSTSSLGLFGAGYSVSTGGFVSKINPSGNTLAFNVMLDGSGFDSALGVAVDSSGIYVTGVTVSADFPIVPASGALQPSNHGLNEEAFVVKVKPDGSGFLFSTYLGGIAEDRGYAIAVDSSGNAYVTGLTYSNDFPVRNAVYPNRNVSGFPYYADAFVAKLNPAGTSLVYSTYLGGQANDYGRAIAVDSTGRVTVGGGTDSVDLPVTAAWQSSPPTPGYQSGFLARLNANGSAFDYATFAGAGQSGVEAVFLDTAGATWITGSANVSCCGVSNWSSVLNGYDMTYNGGHDVYFSKFVDGPAPVLATVTSVPTGRTVIVDGRAVTAPFVFSWQPGTLHTLDGNTPQVSGATVYNFASWAHGGTAKQSVTAGNTAVTYAANYTSGSCSFAIGSPPGSFEFAGNPSHLAYVTTTPGCTWKAESGTSWITVLLGGNDQSASGFVSIRVDPNPGPPRSGNLTIAGTSYTVTQGGGGAALQAPVITYPSGFQILQTRGVNFSWNPVAGATAYDLVVLGSTTPYVTALLYRGSQSGASATSTLIDLPSGQHKFYVRACLGSAADSTCGPPGAADVAVDLSTPTQSPVVLSPAAGQTVTSSIQEFRWQPVAGAERYQVTLIDNTGRAEYQINTPATNTIYSMRGSPSYRLRVAACQAACGPESEVSFNTNLAAVPTSAPAISGATALSPTSYRVNWSAVTGADIYRIAVVQSNTGPGGGALTVASNQTAVPEITLTVPPGPASVIVAACTGRGCGPYSAPFAINPAGPAPATPVIGQPISVTNVDGPLVLFTWSRIPGDNGSNTTYRLYSADLSRNATALDVLTANNFYAGLFAAEGRRYDVVVAANPGPPQAISAPVGFIVQGNSSPSPTPTAPTHEGTVKAGNVQAGWGPVPGASLYQYSVFKIGDSTPTATGMTPGLFALVPLTAQGAGTRYSMILRACSTGTCKPDSDTGWGPWSNAPGGPGVANFTVVP